MKPVRIVLSRRKGFNLQKHSLALNGLPAAVVSRPSKWGNMWRVAKRLPAMLGLMEVPDASEAVRRFKEAVPDLRLEGEPYASVVRRELRGKNLACWCKEGEPCHADVLIEIANA